MDNIKANSTMIDPQIKILAPFGIYYIDKIGSYSKIGDYCQELAKMFEDKGKN